MNLIPIGVVLLAVQNSQLSAGDIKSLIIGHRLVPVMMGHAVRNAGYEYFDNIGQYSLSLESGHKFGTYRIINDEICIKIRGEDESCRAVYEVQDGIFEWKAPYGLVFRTITIDDPS